MNFIIVGPNGRPSILDLIRNFKFKDEVLVYTHYKLKTGKIRWDAYSSLSPEKRIVNTSPPSIRSGDKVIRWGDRIDLGVSSNAIQYNTAQNLNHASNKKLAREILEKAGVAVPKLIKNDELYKADYPVVLRPSRHRAGLNFFVINSDEDLVKATSRFKSKEEYYISEVYPKTEEYRVHCASGKALLIKRKPEPPDKSVVAWNFHQNELPWTTIERRNYDIDMVKMALKAVSALGLDFGAVDIMSKPTNKKLPKHVVIEVNTAPSYTPYLILKYGTYFDLAFSSPKKLDPWEYEKFTKGESLAWKNYQLKNEKKKK